MEPQNPQRDMAVEKEQRWWHQNPDFNIYYKSEHRNKPLHIWSSTICQGNQEYSRRKRQTFQ